MSEAEVPGWPSPGEVGATIWKAQRAVERAVDARLAQLGISSAIFRVLRQLDKEPGQSAADLARQLGFAPQSVAAALERAQLAGLIARSPHPVHGRVRQLFLTDGGYAAYGRAAGLIRGVERALAGGLSDDDRTLLRDQLIGIATRAAALTAGDTSRVSAPQNGHGWRSDQPDTGREEAL